MDITCLQPLDGLRDLPFLAPGASPAGVNNAFILSRPGHPFWTHLLARVERSHLSWGLPYVENMLSTGCMFFSNAWMDYTSTLTRNDSHLEKRVFVLADEKQDLAPHMLRGAVKTPLFDHAGASSWHKRDAAAAKMAAEWYLRVGLLIIALAIVLLCWQPWKKESREPPKYIRRRPWTGLPLGAAEEEDFSEFATTRVRERGEEHSD
ncbi:hypothetical protein BDY17DRAFT_289134 [Neohortaea acidophila]|uniref:Uncharacterized protein n=1 Tax=Neohortaea acidophila TaxID=245834 RepID=A0A6A6Q623_9PEZI|nr:uncharacterized protein BDY17DRAFT_289134 [Neohortaea acidophila]KAF2487521.1 hypothetical protein BDY17DRAFT_289134 [Neohortaea acidophila]